MDFSPEQRRKAAEQLCELVYGASWQEYSREYQLEEINRVVAGRGIQIAAAAAVPMQCQLNAAVDLLRRLRTNFTDSDDCDCESCKAARELSDFLADFPAVEGSHE